MNKKKRENNEKIEKILNKIKTDRQKRFFAIKYHTNTSFFLSFYFHYDYKLDSLIQML